MITYRAHPFSPRKYLPTPLKVTRRFQTPSHNTKDPKILLDLNWQIVETWGEAHPVEG